ncbi:MAG TPA: L-histidine N(alpha)-methyltransferase [Mycobacteriales bacterium]|nr:L-histidine N(alpha)-methyltransferase [Mycobacteriales bacterium]
MTSFVLDNHLPADFLAAALRRDVLAGLTAEPKALPPKWFYDERGCALFERITELPEYYPTRTERMILAERATQIAQTTRARSLVELGAGSAAKTRLLLSALCCAGTLRRYLPVDVSVATLVGAGEALSREYDGLTVHAVAADFEHQMDRLPAQLGTALTAFLGGTIGNFEPAERAAFLAAVRGGLVEDDWFLLGTDLVKDPAMLVPAYDDSAGVTAEFNRNVLHVVNRELKADFEPAAFRHVALWDAAAEWVEMRLESERDQEVRVEELDLTVQFAAGEQVRTEVSAKFRAEGVARELVAAGFALHEWWTDPAGLFAVSLARAV